MTYELVYSENDNRIYHGDAIDVMVDLIREGIKVNMLLSDPPYGMSYKSNYATEKLMTKVIAGDNDLSLIIAMLPYIDQLLAENSHAYMFCHPMLSGEMKMLMRRFWDVKNVLSWWKGEGGTMGDLKSGYSADYESIVYAVKGQRELLGSRPRTTIRYPWSSRNDPVHPTVKPVPVLRKLIRHSSSPNEIVFDPTCGSGTALRAALEEGRRFIGIEFDADHVKTSIARVKKIQQGEFMMIEDSVDIEEELENM